MKPILSKPHDKDCYSMKCVCDGKWASPWAFLPLEEYHWAKAKPYKGGKKGQPNKRSWRQWFLVVCNDPKCPAQAKVSDKWIMEQLHLALIEEE